MKNKSRILVSLVWIIGVILVWEGVSFLLAQVLKDPMAAKKLPYLHDVIQIFFLNFDRMMQEGNTTLTRAGIGFLCGAGVGFVLAIFMSLSKTIERVAMPYLLISQMIPILGLAPIIFNLVKDINSARIVIAAYITFFPVAVNMLSGLKAVEKERLSLMYSYAANIPTSYTKLMLPSCLPAFFSGLKIAAPLSVTASILMDMLSIKDGIGAVMIYSLYGGDNKFWPAVLTGALMGILSYFLISLLEWLCIPWKRASRAKAGED